MALSQRNNYKNQHVYSSTLAPIILVPLWNPILGIGLLSGGVDQGIDTTGRDNKAAQVTLPICLAALFATVRPRKSSISYLRFIG